MTTNHTIDGSAQGEQDDFYVFPDPPEDHDDKAANFDHLSINGNAYRLFDYLGSPETTLVAGEQYLAPAITRNVDGLRYPDLLVAFGVDPEAYRRREAYVIADQGKPPDWVLEVASRSTGRVDVTEKREDYAALEIPEYWRFDKTGAYHGARLAGDRLVDGEYVPVGIEELADGSLQGFSPVLNLQLRWTHGVLEFCDPATGEPIASLKSERKGRLAAEARADAAETRADDAESRADGEREARLAAESRAEDEREARLAAESRVRELEARMRDSGT